jgi:hypothetical protein
MDNEQNENGNADPLVGRVSRNAVSHREQEKRRHAHVDSQPDDQTQRHFSDLLFLADLFEPGGNVVFQ